MKAGGTIQRRTEVEYAIEEERVQHCPGEKMRKGLSQVCPSLHRGKDSKTEERDPAERT